MWWNQASDTASEKGTQLPLNVGGGRCSSISEMDIKSYFISHGENKNMWRGFNPKPPQLLFSVLPLLMRSFREREFRILHNNPTLIRHVLIFRSAQDS